MTEPFVALDHNRFIPHPPTGDDLKRYEMIRATGLSLAALFRELCPESRELERAIDHIDDAVMLANAAVARHGTGTEGS